MNNHNQQSINVDYSCLEEDGDEILATPTSAQEMHIDKTLAQLGANSNENDVADALLLKEIENVDGVVGEDLSAEDKLEDIFKEMLESAEGSPKLDTLEHENENRKDEENNTSNNYNFEIATVANEQQQQVNDDWTTETQPINILDYRRFWQESVSSDDEPEPEVYHLNRPGKGKQLPPDMRSSPEPDADSSKEEEDENKPSLPNKRARCTDIEAADTGPKTAVDTTIIKHNENDEIASSSTEIVEQQMQNKMEAKADSNSSMDENENESNHDDDVGNDNTKEPENEFRTFKKIPVFVVDYHNHVLVFIYRAIAMRFLPLNDNVLIHFDSHPDMVISSTLDAQTCFNKQELLDELSIEDWIMPACYTGQFGRIIWLKNSWAKQIDVGHYEFMIGTIANKLGVDMPHSYFLSEGNYYSTNQLKNARQIKLDVCEMDTQHVDAAKLLTKEADAKRCILDIDLDYFSTNNPFLDLYPLANCYAQLKEIFDYEVTEDFNETAEKRRAQLTALKYIFEYLQEHRTLSGRAENYDNNALPPNTIERICKLVKSLYEHYAEASIDFIQIYDAGCTTDNDGLPHHPSTSHELEMHYRRFKYFLEHLPFPPICVTIACSVADSYTPADQNDAILKRVLSILSEVYGDKINAEPISYDGTEKFNMLQL